MNIRSLDDGLTPEQRIANTIRAARDSVWVINNELANFAANNNVLTEEMQGNIQRNVEHLEIVMTREGIADSSEDLSDLTNAIAAGRAVLPQ